MRQRSNEAKMRVLVTYAVETEFAPWRKLRDLSSREAGGFAVYEAKIGRATVDFVVTGMGIGNARRGAEAVINREHKACIGAGFAGALKPSLKIGDVLAARAIRELGKNKTLQCSGNLFMAACENQAIEAQLFLTTDRVIGTAEEKQRLSPFADAVDMESFATISVARENRVSFVAVRVISDRFDEDMPADIDATIDEQGRLKAAGLVKHIASHPLQIPALWRLGRKSRTAAEALAHFLEAFIKELSFRSHGWPPPDLAEVAGR
jgi:adenosylhomocysteine nucleosidase